MTGGIALTEKKNSGRGILGGLQTGTASGKRDDSVIRNRNSST